MYVNIINETEDAVTGFGVNCRIDGTRSSGGMGISDVAMNKGEVMDFGFDLDNNDELNESYSVVIDVQVFLEDGTSTYVQYVAKWDAEPQGEYNFVVSGSMAEGYELTADFDCTITPAVG